MTAHNAAGNRIVTSHVSTLTLLGETLPPTLLSTTPSPALTSSGGVDGSLAISAILAIIILATALLLSLYCYKRYLVGKFVLKGLSHEMEGGGMLVDIFRKLLKNAIASDEKNVILLKGQLTMSV